MIDTLITHKKDDNRNWICDECGDYFHYPHEGEVTAGFGMCNKCWEVIMKKV